MGLSKPMPSLSPTGPDRQALRCRAGFVSNGRPALPALQEPLRLRYIPAYALAPPP